MSMEVQFNRQLIQKYDVAAPRYTSYPTALQFHEGFDTEAYRRHVDSSNNELIPSPISLYVHLPFCHSLCYYCACNKKITQNVSKGADYLALLFQEITMRGRLIDSDRLVSQLHFGGGTPTFFDDEQLSLLMKNLSSAFTFEPSKDREFSIEIDPRTVDDSRLDRLAQMGFNRISMGVQDLDYGVQAAINRHQDSTATLELLESARELGFNSVSLDLIYGLPLQTTTSFEKTLATVISARPDRLAVYNYAHMPQVFRAQRLIKDNDLPTAEEKMDLMELTIQMLTQAGYIYIGMDHFALPDDELCLAMEQGQLQRNFQGYSTKSECDLVGVGVSAIGKVGDCFVQNLKDIPSWSRAVSAGVLPIWRGISLSQEDRLRQSVIEDIMCRAGVSFAEYENRFQISFDDHFALEMDSLQRLADDGLLALDEEGLSVTADGRLLLRIIASVFDEYLNCKPHQNLFSKVI